MLAKLSWACRVHREKKTKTKQTLRHRADNNCYCPCEGALSHSFLGHSSKNLLLCQVTTLLQRSATRVSILVIPYHVFSVQRFHFLGWSLSHKDKNMSTYCLRSWRPCFQDSWLLSDPEVSFSLASSGGGEEGHKSGLHRQHSLWHYFHSVNTTRTFLHYSILATPHTSAWLLPVSQQWIRVKKRILRLFKLSHWHFCSSCTHDYE